MSTESIEAKDEEAYLKTPHPELQVLYQTFPADQKKCFLKLSPELQKLFLTLSPAQINNFKKLNKDELDVFEIKDTADAANFLQKRTSSQNQTSILMPKIRLLQVYNHIILI